jgi:hypothetical protein
VTPRPRRWMGCCSRCVLFLQLLPLTLRLLVAGVCCPCSCCYHHIQSPCERGTQCPFHACNGKYLMGDSRQYCCCLLCSCHCMTCATSFSWWPPSCYGSTSTNAPPPPNPHLYIHTHTYTHTHTHAHIHTTDG